MDFFVFQFVMTPIEMAVGVFTKLHGEVQESPLPQAANSSTSSKLSGGTAGEIGGTAATANAPVQTTLVATVPVGVGAGQMMQVQTPSGGMVMVQVPAGVISGQSIQIQV